MNIQIHVDVNKLLCMSNLDVTVYISVSSPNS